MMPSRPVPAPPAARRSGLARTWLIGAVVLIALGLGFGLRTGSRRGAQPGERVRATLSLARALGTGDTVGYARALAPPAFVFPDDHGEHPDFRTEWWYLTGHLEDEAGRRFGYQLTLFRSALAPAMPERGSDWATRHAWMAHFALTDVAGKRFFASERFARGALGLAGAGTDPFRVWLEDWSIGSEPAAPAPPSGSTLRPATEADSRPGESVFPIRVRASEGEAAIDLRIEAGKPIVLHGDAGLSRKGPEPGNASYYYSFTRLPTSGLVRAGALESSVTGTSWLDREWSTSVLAEGLAGWDWFALQLEQGEELMFYRLRTGAGSAGAFSAGTWVDARGVSSGIDAGDVVLVETDEWLSPLDGTRYPSGWRLRVPRLGLDLGIRPVLRDQEMNLSVRYWEGAVDVRGTQDGAPALGRGYVELTGYGPAPAARRARTRTPIGDR